MGTDPAFNTWRLLQIERFSYANYFLLGEATILPPASALKSYQITLFMQESTCDPLNTTNELK